MTATAPTRDPSRARVLERWIVALGAAFLLPLGGCQETPLFAPVTTSIELSDTAPVLGIDDTVPIDIVVRDQTGRVLDPAIETRVLSTQDPTICVVLASAIVGVGGGSCRLAVQAGPLRRAFIATVVPAVLRVTVARTGRPPISLDSITFPIPVTVGDSLRLSATIASVPTRDLTRRYGVAWSVDDPIALEVAAPADPVTIVRATAPGPVVVLLSTGLGNRSIRVQVAAPPP